MNKYIISHDAKRNVLFKIRKEQVNLVGHSLSAN